MADMRKLALQRNGCPVAVHQEAEVIGQMQGHFLHRCIVLECGHVINNVECIHVKVRVDLHLKMFVFGFLHPQLLFIDINFERFNLPGHFVKGGCHQRKFPGVGSLCRQPHIKHPVAELSHSADQTG
ncbi:hypothetical protein D3C80_1611560 [compost metagenome]